FASLFAEGDVYGEEGSCEASNLLASRPCISFVGDRAFINLVTIPATSGDRLILRFIGGPPETEVPLPPMVLALLAAALASVGWRRANMA
ncbi:MAG: hypothetical protein AAFU66_04980, partial [Pseudomonadota bacterium]